MRRLRNCRRLGDPAPASTNPEGQGRERTRLRRGCFKCYLLWRTGGRTLGALHGCNYAPVTQPTGVGRQGMGDEGFRGPQVCKIVGITYRQLDYWARTDLIRPSIADARGSGTQRRYSYRDLLELKVIKSL